jgi:hypothetical protein
MSDEPYGLNELDDRAFTGEYGLRTPTGAQPRVLRPGDWLLDGTRVLAKPAARAKGGVLVIVSDISGRHDMVLLSRITLALDPERTDPLETNRQICIQHNGHKPYGTSGYCARCGADMPKNRDSLSEWITPDGPWCRKRWVLRDPGPDTLVCMCLLDPGHEGDCRSRSGQFHNLENSIQVQQFDQLKPR